MVIWKSLKCLSYRDLGRQNEIFEITIVGETGFFPEHGIYASLAMT
jgi:hypothetical protein